MPNQIPHKSSYLPIKYHFSIATQYPHKHTPPTAMATTTALSGVSLSHAKLVPKPHAPKSLRTLCMNNHQPWIGNQFKSGRMSVRAMSGSPLSDQVSESIKGAEEVCAGDPVSGECAAAWDEVEELSAAVSHQKQKAKETDALETFCKDNPETDECRTYDN